MFQRRYDDVSILVVLHESAPGSVLLAGQHLVQHGHLRIHSVLCFLNHDAARPVEYFIGHDDAAAHGQAMHEPAIVASRGEP